MTLDQLNSVSSDLLLSFAEHEHLIINADPNVALTKLKTLLADDLFLNLTKSLEISEFVERVFIQYPDLAGATLKWLAQAENIATSQLKKDMSQTFSVFCQLHDQSIVLTESQMMKRLRVFRACFTASIAALELDDQIRIEKSTRILSLLADGLIKAAYQWSLQQLQKRHGHAVIEKNAESQNIKLIENSGLIEKGEPAETTEFLLNEEGKPHSSHRLQSQSLVILAMGKLGGNELNFSSDIDLIFFYPEDGQTQSLATSEKIRVIDNSRFFHRVSSLLIKLLDEVTEDGFVYRVDMRLRPYGDSGALVCSFAQAEDYYQEQGREWERFAMLRARIISGKPVERKKLNQIIQPFSFRRYIDYGVFDSIRSMKAMIQREVRRKGLVGNIKLGAGGIREIEFMVQSLQLIQGGRNKALRQRNTLKVIPKLVEAKLLPQLVATDLIESYRFLRRLEHCLQELADKQTQQLPDTEVEQKKITLVMGFAKWSLLMDKVNAVQYVVNQHFSEVFGEERQQALTQDDFFQSLAEGHIDAQQLHQHFDGEQAKNFCSAEICQTFIARLNKFSNQSAVLKLSSRGAKRLKTFFPSLLAACFKTEQPELTLERLLTVLQAIMKRTAYLELLSENPPILQHLVDLIGRSAWVAQRLADYPVLLDELLYPNSLYEPLLALDLKAELQQTLLRIDIDDEEALLDTVRAFKQTNELRVAAALLDERLSISQVSRYLTQLAEVILQTTLKHCWHFIQKRHGIPASLQPEQNYGFAIIGYGKLGGFELGFGSDLDLVFLFDQPIDGQTNGNRAIGNSRFYTRLAQKIIHFLSTRTNLGLLYEVDMRLRPSGSSGLLVSHVDAYRDYQLESAWTWEHQALVRARMVAGDEQVEQHFTRIRKAALGKPRELSQLRQDVASMRGKMRQQLEQSRLDQVDLKQVKGGLVDIEFIAQYYCLAMSSTQFDSQQPITNTPNNTVDAIKQAAENQWLDAQSALQLIKCYRLFRNQLNEEALITGDRFVDAELYLDERESVSQLWLSIFTGYK